MEFGWVVGWVGLKKLDPRTTLVAVRKVRCYRVQCTVQVSENDLHKIQTASGPNELDLSVNVGIHMQRYIMMMMMIDSLYGS